MNFNYFDYIENNSMSFGAKEGTWITFLGDKRTVYHFFHILTYDKLRCFDEGFVTILYLY